MNELRDPFYTTWASFKTCGPPDSATYLPKAPNMASSMWNGPNATDTLLNFGDSSA